LGAQVSVVEYLDRIIPGMDASLSKELTKVLKQGMKFYVSHKVKSVERNGEGVVFKLKMQKEKQLRWKEIILVSVGRRPYTDGFEC
jgi:dihydrolipoamide dehydrogenase